jgi:hypothetical protein
MLADLANSVRTPSNRWLRNKIGQLPFDAKVFDPSPLSLDASVETVECESTVAFWVIVLRSAGGGAGVLLAFENVTVSEMCLLVGNCNAQGDDEDRNGSENMGRDVEPSSRRRMGATLGLLVVAERYGRASGLGDVRSQSTTYKPDYITSDPSSSTSPTTANANPSTFSFIPSATSNRMKVKLSNFPLQNTHPSTGDGARALSHSNVPSPELSTFTSHE